MSREPDTNDPAIGDQGSAVAPRRSSASSSDRKATDAGSGSSEYPASAEWSEVRRRVVTPPHHLVLEMAARLAHGVPGNIIEFGVFQGSSTRVLRRAVRGLQRGQLLGPRKEIFACDSFKGLPEPYENLERGAFACAPPNIPGVQMVEGYFEDSLTDDLARRVGRVALASFDADLYSSTLCALRWLTPLLDAGSLLLFDQYLGGGGTEERRAHEDWERETGLRTVRIAEFLREVSGRGGNQDHGSVPDRRVLFQVVGAAGPVPPNVFGIAEARRTGRIFRQRLTRLAKDPWTYLSR